MRARARARARVCVCERERERERAELLSSTSYALWQEGVNSKVAKKETPLPQLQPFGTSGGSRKGQVGIWN